MIAGGLDAFGGGLLRKQKSSIGNNTVDMKNFFATSGKIIRIVFSKKHNGA